MCLKKEGGYPSRLLTTKSTIKINYDCDSVAKLAIFIGLCAMVKRLFFNHDINYRCNYRCRGGHSFLGV